MIPQSLQAHGGIVVAVEALESVKSVISPDRQTTWAVVCGSGGGVIQEHGMALRDLF